MKIFPFYKSFKINYILSLVLSLLFLFENSSYNFINIFTTILGTISTISTFYLIFWILTLPFLFFSKVRFYFATLLFVAFNLFLVTDFFIFRLYNTHINAMILDIALSPAALSSVDLGVYPYLAVFVLILFFISFQYFIFKKIKQEPFLNKSFFIFIFLAIILDKATFGIANFYSYTDITDKMRVIPYYQPMSINGFLKKNFGIHPSAKPLNMANTNGSGNRLEYPKEELKYSKDFTSDNILIIMIDALRWDMIDKETAPNMYELKQNSISFENHFSGGNATRFGVFSFFYGLNAPYWFSFLDEQKSPVLFDALAYRNFDISIFASSDLNWPEFRRTAFAKLNDKVVDKMQGEPWKKDKELTSKVLKYLDENSQKQFFSFVFFDAPHQASYPQTHSKFKPDNEGLKNYLTVNPSQKEYLFNQYKNSIYYDDMLIGELINRLKSLNIYDKTRIIITADHGEEFYESGGFGHNSSFSKEQIKPLFFMKIPNETPRVVQNMTSHIDVVPTLMNWLGVQNLPNSYSFGEDLLNPNYKRDYSVIGNWNNSAIVEAGHTLLFSSHPLISGTKVYDMQSYEELDSSISREHSKTILKVIDENARFYK